MSAQTATRNLEALARIGGDLLGVIEELQEAGPTYAPALHMALAAEATVEQAIARLNDVQNQKAAAERRPIENRLYPIPGVPGARGYTREAFEFDRLGTTGSFAGV